MALKQWPNAALSGSYFVELPLPHISRKRPQCSGTDEIPDSVVCGPDPERHRGCNSDVCRRRQ
jgi:hypothetical protein